MKYATKGSTLGYQEFKTGDASKELEWATAAASIKARLLEFPKKQFFAGATKFSGSYSTAQTKGRAFLTVVVVLVVVLTPTALSG